jgi:hypothetical protein
MQEVWINFFQDMEAGCRMQYDHLRHVWRTELEQFQQTNLSADLNALPSLTALEQALRRVPKGKASGPDGLPGELCHHQPAAVARLLYPGLLKTMLHGHEPLVFKGGILTAAYKGKGPPDHCSSFRSLLISNHLGKAIHRSIRQHTATIYESFLHRQQTGGRRGIPVQLAMHQIRAFSRDAKARGWSTGILFVDLTEAFYRVLREAPLGGVVSDEVLAHLMQKLRMPADSLHSIHELLRETPAIEQAGLDAVHQRSFRAIHQSTHFWMRGQADVSRTAMGTRPGDSFADIIFGYMWKTVLAKLETFLLTEKAITPLQMHHQLPLFGHSFGAEGSSCFLGPTWMDDLAVCLTTSTAGSLPSVMARTTSFMLDLCAFHCLSPNLKAGKTELLLCFRGSGSRAPKAKFYGPSSAKVLPIVTERDTKYVRLVTSYRHLGGVCHHAGDQRVELRQRQAIAQQALSQHRRLIYHNKAILWEKRVELFQSLVLTKLLYGAESWIATDAKTQEKFRVYVIGLYKRLARLPRDGHFTDEAILAKVALPSPDELLRRARLRYFATLVKADFEDAWTMLAIDTEWRSLLKNASSLQDPRQHYPQWLLLIQTSPRYWKRLVRCAGEHAVLQRCKKQHQVKDFHVQALERIWHFWVNGASGDSHGFIV